MNLYRIITGHCVRYLVAAGNPAEAVGTLREMEAEADCLDRFDAEHIEVSMVTAMEASNKFFPDDDEAGPRRSWAAECAVQSKPIVLACSEWP